MTTVFITGSSGFVGKNLIKTLSPFYDIYINQKGISPKLHQEVVLHLAGKTPVLKGISNYRDYYKVNTDLTKELYDTFLASSAKVFITLSSTKAIADEIIGELSEQTPPNPITHYGKSKFLAEKYILSQPLPEGKRVYILRPCLIHGPGSKGNLNSLYKLVLKKIPWPLGLFENSRSYLSIENLCFVIKELIERKDIQSGVYNISDDEPISTNELICLIAHSLNRKPKIWKISKPLIEKLAIFGNLFHLPLNSENLQKLTSSYVVSNRKIKTALGKSLPISSREGLLKTMQSFKNI